MKDQDVRDIVCIIILLTLCGLSFTKTPIPEYLINWGDMAFAFFFGVRTGVANANALKKTDAASTEEKTP